jgi:hypothetical protein
MCKMGSENAHGWTQKQRMVLSLNLSEWYHEDGDEFLNQIVWVTGDEIQHDICELLLFLLSLHNVLWISILGQFLS